MKISDLGLELVKHFEGRYLKGYVCPGNALTIGYGHTGSVDGKPITTDMVITADKATQLLREDMARFETAVEKAVKVALTQQQFDALVSFTFNVGAGALGRSTLLRLLNQGKYDLVPTQLLRWNQAGGRILAGLVRRRRAEGHLWTTGENKFHF